MNNESTFSFFINWDPSTTCNTPMNITDIFLQSYIKKKNSKQTFWRVTIWETLSEKNYHNLKITHWGLSWRSSGWGSALPPQGCKFSPWWEKWNMAQPKKKRADYSKWIQTTGKQYSITSAAINRFESPVSSLGAKSQVTLNFRRREGQLR